MTKNIEAINQWFKHIGEHILKLRWYIILTLILINIVAVIGVRSIQIDVSNESWFLENDPLTIAKEEFEGIFGNNDYVAILVEADDVFAPDVLQMIRELGEELVETVPFADEVTSLTDIEFTRGTEEGVEIGDIVPDEIPTNPEEVEAIRRLAFSKDFLVNRLFSDDSTQAWISLRLNEYPADWDVTAGKYPRQLVGQKVLDIIRQDKYKAYALKATGTPVMNCEQKQFFSREANRTMVIAFCVAVAVLFVFLRTLPGIVVPIITALSSILWIFGAMGFLGIKVDNTVMTLPIYLGMAVSIGYSVHIFNFFNKLFLSTGRRRASILYAIEETGWPIFFTAATTISALVSFYFVPIRQVRWMGVSSASVVFTTYLIVMTLTPAFLSFGKDRDPRHLSDRTGEQWSKPLFIRLSQWTLEHVKPIMISFFLLVLVFFAGLTQVYVSMNHEKTYGLDIPYMSRFHYVANSKIGSMYSYDLTLTFDQSDRVKDPDILKKFDGLIAEVKQFSLVKRVSSLLDVIKDMNQVMHNDDPAYYRVPDEQNLVAQLLLLYEMADGTEQENWVDYNYTTLRLMVEVSDFDTAEVEREFHYLENRVKELFPDAELGMVGSVIQFSVVQNYIAKGEIASFLIALFVIGLLMMLVFRSVRTGLIGMIPNLAPVLVVGGMMGFLDIPLDMTSMMIIPMLLGLAVDDTIHFINHSKLEFQRTLSYRESVEKTFQTVGKAIFITSFILICTFSVYMTSIAKFFLNIGILAASGVLSALLADYFITPILILWTKPFGDESHESPEKISGDTTEMYERPNVVK